MTNNTIPYDCKNDGCGECKVCEYLSFHEWVQSVGGSNAHTDRDPELDAYLLEKYNIRA